MAAASACPDHDTLQRLAVGALPPDAVERLAEHCEVCEHCVASLHRMKADDTLLSAVAAQATRHDTPDPALLDPLIARLKPLAPASADEAPRGSVFPTVAPDTASGDHPAWVKACDEATMELSAFLAPARQPDEIGRLGDYRVLRVLGQGGMGLVLAAEDTKLGRPVALKVMRPELARKPAARDRFLLEARAAAKLEHDHIVPIYQVGEDRGVPYIAMPLLRGRSLSDRLKEGTALTLPEILRVGREIAQGLAAAHGHGLIHRDIKPANVWLDANAEGRARILDFGLARCAAELERQHLTQSGTILGTPSYMAPEQAAGKKAIDGRADLFSLGVILYQLSTGELPFQGADTMSTLYALATHQPAAPIRVNPHLPPALSELIMKLLAKDPAERPANAREVIAALAAIEKQSAGSAVAVRGRVSEEATAAEIPEPAPVGAKAGRRRWVLIGTAVAAGLAATLAALTVIFWETPKGTVRIETNDDDIEVVFAKGAPTIKGADKKHVITLAPGEHGLKVKRGDLEFETDKFILKKGGEVTLKVELLKGKMRVMQGDRVLGEKELPRPAKVPPKLNEWVQLFNGKNLTGWKTYPKGTGNWVVEEGALTCTGVESHLFTERDDYENFHLRAECKINEKGNSGIFCRAEFVFGWMPGYEAQIALSADRVKTGSIYPYKLWADVGTLKEIVVLKPTHEANEWFTYEVICRGNHLTTRVDGRTVVDWKDPKKRYTKGHIALQHLSQATRVRFRKVEVKELAPEEVGWKPLFDGPDLKGWEGLPGLWTFKDGVLTGKADKLGFNTCLCSTKTYRDFELKFKVKLIEGNSGVQIRSEVIDGKKFVVRGPQADMGDKYWGSLYGERFGGMMKDAAGFIQKGIKAGEFNDYYVKVAGKRVTIKVNGETAVDDEFERLPDEGILGWQLHMMGTEVQFRDVLIREPLAAK